MPSLLETTSPAVLAVPGDEDKSCVDHTVESVRYANFEGISYRESETPSTHKNCDKCPQSDKNGGI
jgi:hypothetical protein